MDRRLQGGRRHLGDHHHRCGRHLDGARAHSTNLFSIQANFSQYTVNLYQVKIQRRKI